MRNGVWHAESSSSPGTGCLMILVMPGFLRASVPPWFKWKTIDEPQRHRATELEPFPSLMADVSTEWNKPVHPEIAGGTPPTNTERGAGRSPPRKSTL